MILEPVGTLKVRVPDGLVGDVIGDLNKRRGRVLGMNPDEHAKGRTIVEAEVPMAEMANYTIALRALSQGRGVFDYEFTRLGGSTGQCGAEDHRGRQKECG